MVTTPVIFPRVRRLYWVTQNIPSKGVKLNEFDLPESVWSFKSRARDARLLKRMGLVSFKTTTLGVPKTINLVRSPELEELQKLYLMVKMHRFEKKI